MESKLAIAGMALLSVVALAGWTRKPAASPAAVLDQTAQPGMAAFVPGQPGMPGYGMQPGNEPGTMQPKANYAMYQPVQAPAPAYAPAPAPRRLKANRYAAPRYTEPAPRYREYRETRPWTHSAAIVGGSAAGGAAIGALAGGGKGAAIGALAGGAGGFIYDRLTRNRH